MPRGRVGERESDTQLRRLVEEVMLVSTWVWPASGCTVSLCQSHVGLEGTVDDGSVDESLLRAPPRDGH